jgi:ABC-type nitrate/sulfonate/bicarbonate transport system substrate-binding protein
MKKIILSMISPLLAGVLLLPGKAASADKINVTLPSKSFQFIIFPLAKERGYMREEGIDLNIVFMASTSGLQAVVAGEMDFTGSGSSALVAITQGNAPLKTVLAVNDQVLQWLMVRPQYSAFSELKNKKVAVTGIAAVATFMLKKVAPKYGLDGNKDLTFLALPPGQRLAALQSGVVDAGLLSSEERFAALDQGMKEILYLGKEVKNSWGTVATNDQFIKAKPKLMHGFMRALLKAPGQAEPRGRDGHDDEIFRVRQGIGRAHLRRHDWNFYDQRRGRRGNAEKRSRHRSRGPESHKGSAHRARLRFQLRKESGRRADPSGLETLAITRLKAESLS